MMTLTTTALIDLAAAPRIASPSEGYKDNAYIHTQGGRFYAARPTWDISAVAHALAQTARYRGNADKFYSVAEHSILVSLLMEEVVGGSPYEGILHDATESVLPDVSSPFKHLLPDLRAMDKQFDKSLREHFGLPAGGKSKEAGIADWLALFIEAAQILPERGEDFEDPYNLREEALKLRRQGWMVRGFDWQHAKGLYLSRFEAVRPK
jgi:5'-deoxynucleotidase YfbR-like HD superfamily hydrolase